ncbi:MAG: hypothetical protein RL018_852 [Pseudomonadota bacterium]|jgi:hypothetical protein
MTPALKNISAIGYRLSAIGYRLSADTGTLAQHINYQSKLGDKLGS